MNKEQTQEYIAVMQAFIEGKEIQFSDTSGKTWQDHSNASRVYWNWSTLKYRVKPEPIKYRRYISKTYYIDGTTSSHRLGVGLVLGAKKRVDTLQYGIEWVAPETLEKGSGFIRWIDTEWQEEVV